MSVGVGVGQPDDGHLVGEGSCSSGVGVAVPPFGVGVDVPAGVGVSVASGVSVGSGGGVSVGNAVSVGSGVDEGVRFGVGVWMITPGEAVVTVVGVRDGVGVRVALPAPPPPSPPPMAPAMSAPPANANSRRPTTPPMNHITLLRSQP